MFKTAPGGLLISILLCGLYFSCNIKTRHFQKISRLDFLDNLDTAYTASDTFHERPLKYLALYYLINKKTIIRTNFSEIDDFIRTDSFLQNKIHKNYSQLSIFFYRKSRSINRVIEFQSSKELALCNSDIVVQYLWENGVPSDTFYYKNGQIEGSQRIELLEVDTVSR